MELVNMVFNVDYWDGVAKSKDFNLVCYGFHSKESFYAFKEPIENLKKGMIFLDFGCGPGRIASTVAPAVKEYHGVDVSEELLKIAKDHYKDYLNVFFHKNNGTDLSIFESKMFDYVYERLVLIHVPKEWIVGYIKEFYRVMKVGGFLFIPDFPKHDISTNGFSQEEIRILFSEFASISIEDCERFYCLRCFK